MQADGTFELTDLIGLRELRLRAAPRGWTLKDVLAGDRSLLDSRRTSTAARRSPTRGDPHRSSLPVNGQRRHRRRRRRSPITPSSCFRRIATLLRNARRWARWVRPDLRGDFVVDDLLPGAYLAVAVDEVDDAQWLNADYLARFRSRATRVTLGDGDKQDTRARDDEPAMTAALLLAALLQAPAQPAAGCNDRRRSRPRRASRWSSASTRARPVVVQRTAVFPSRRADRRRRRVRILRHPPGHCTT